MEPSADLIVHAAECHAIKRHGGHLQQTFFAGVRVLAQQHGDRTAGWEFWRAAESAPPGIELASQLRRHQRQNRTIWHSVIRRLLRGVLLKGEEHLLRIVCHIVVPFAPQLGHSSQYRFETGHPLDRLRRKICSAKEGLQVRCEEYAQRPPAPAGHQLDRRHIDLVDVRPLLAVDFDGDEVLVEDFGRLRILERLTFHHVAPVAGRVPDRQEDRLVLLLGPVECFFSPWVPVDRVVDMLEEIGAGFVREPIGVSCRRRFLLRLLRSVWRTRHFLATFLRATVFPNKTEHTGREQQRQQRE